MLSTVPDQAGVPRAPWRPRRRPDEGGEASRSRRCPPSGTPTARTTGPRRPRAPARRRGRGDLRQAGPEFSLEPGTVRGDRPQVGGELRVPASEQVEQHRRPDDEHAGVPAVAGRREVLSVAVRTDGFSTNSLADGRRAAAVTGGSLAEVDVAERRRTGTLARCRASPASRRGRPPRPPAPTRRRRPGRDRGRRRRGPSPRRVVALQERGWPGRSRPSSRAGEAGEHPVRVHLGQLATDRVAVRRPVTTTTRSAPAARAGRGALQGPAGAGQVVQGTGTDRRDSGYSRVPAPPAGITAQKWSIGPVSLGMLAANW